MNARHAYRYSGGARPIYERKNQRCLMTNPPLRHPNPSRAQNQLRKRIKSRFQNRSGQNSRLKSPRRRTKTKQLRLHKIRRSSVSKLPLAKQSKGLPEQGPEALATILVQTGRDSETWCACFCDLYHTSKCGDSHGTKLLRYRCHRSSRCGLRSLGVDSARSQHEPRTLLRLQS